jgi:NADH-quinone oxidoreductase subunit J
MAFDTFVFYFLAALLVFAALRVITSRNPVNAVLYLVLSFFTAGGLWLLLRAEYLGIMLVLVYVGAVMVLFLFVVMMLDINLERLRQGFWSYLPIGAVIAILMVLEMIVVVGGRYFDSTAMPVPPEPPTGYSNTKELARLIYTDYVYPFEIASVILLVAIIAAIALTMRRRKDSKLMEPSKQIAVQRKDRVRIVSIPAEKK